MYMLALLNARIVDENDVYVGNIYVKDGKIAAITLPSVLFEAEETFDLKGKLVFPGLVDTHSHLGDPTRPDVETVRTATTAAAIGGFTTVIDMPNNDPCILNAERFEKKLEYTQKESFVLS